MLFASLMPWEEVDETYAPQFSPRTWAPAKPVRLAFGALFIKQRLGLTDEGTIEQILEVPVQASGCTDGQMQARPHH